MPLSSPSVPAPVTISEGFGGSETRHDGIVRRESSFVPPGQDAGITRTTSQRQGTSVGMTPTPSQRSQWRQVNTYWALEVNLGEALPAVGERLHRCPSAHRPMDLTAQRTWLRLPYDIMIEITFVSLQKTLSRYLLYVQGAARALYQSSFAST